MIGWALVSHHDYGVSRAFYGFSEEFQRGGLVALFCDVGFEHLPFVVYRSAKAVRLAPNLDEDLVQMPAPLFDSPHILGPPLTDLICEVCPEAINPEPNAFVANIYAALVQ